jgi:hypothetical protein
VTAVVSVPIALAGVVGYALSQGRDIPSKEAPEVGRVYFLAPLCSLAGTGLFDRPEIEIQYFKTNAEAMAWGENDIERRMARQRPDAFTRMLIEGAERVRGRRRHDLR